jgi:hypothetical protein
VKQRRDGLDPAARPHLGGKAFASTGCTGVVEDEAACVVLRRGDAAMSIAKRSTSPGGIMRTQRSVETREERSRRLSRESQMKKDAAAANEAAVDRMIRQNIAEYGP